eukprot:3147352-Alexandrium_andersonii.AAC.1
MSASLVGSEMCIRDRSTTTRRCKGSDATGTNLTAYAAIYPPRLCTAILRGVAAQHAREGRPAPRHVRGRMDRGVA